jgi:hypothetical protein
LSCEGLPIRRKNANEIPNNALIFYPKSLGEAGEAMRPPMLETGGK